MFIGLLVALALVAPGHSVDSLNLNDAIGYVETRVVLPAEANPVRQYARFYAVDPDGARIVGQFVTGIVNAPPGVYVVPYDRLPWILDGDCSNNVSIFYAPGQSDILVTCKGHTPSPPDEK